MLTSDVSIPLNEWHHVAMVRRSNIFSIFIDGTKNSASWTSSINISSTVESVGRAIDGYGYAYFQGYIDEFVTWDYARYLTNFTKPDVPYNPINSIVRDMPIQFRRGNMIERPVLYPGEPYIELDTGKLYVGTIEVGTSTTFVEHAQLLFTIEGANLGVGNQGVKPLKIYLPYVGSGGTIEEIFAVVGTSPSGANLRLDVYKNGSSVFTGTGYIEIATGAYTVSRTTALVGSGAIAKNDYFQLVLTQGDASAADLVLHIRYKWTLTGS